MPRANVLDNAPAEHVVFSTPSTGVLRLFDVADRGDMLHNSEVLFLAPGDHVFAPVTGNVRSQRGAR